MDSKRKRGEGRRLNDSERLQIIESREHPCSESMRSIARQFGINEKVVRIIKKDKEKIKSRIEKMDENSRLKSKRASNPKFPDLEKVLFDWVGAFRKTGLVIPPSLLWLKAKEIANSFGIES